MITPVREARDRGWTNGFGVPLPHRVRKGKG